MPCIGSEGIVTQSSETSPPRSSGRISLPFLAMGSAAVVIVLSLAVIIVTLVGSNAPTTAIASPTATPAPTFAPSPTATLPALATPQLGTGRAQLPRL